MVHGTYPSDHVLPIYLIDPLSLIKEENLMNSKRADKLATGVFIGIAALIIALLVALFTYILVKGVPYITWDFLTTPSSTVREGSGIRDQLFNSVYILFITMLITVPLGVGGGIYMAEYAKPGKITNTIRSCIEVLASLPSIVIGMFGLLVFVNINRMGIHHHRWCTGTDCFQSSCHGKGN